MIKKVFSTIQKNSYQFSKSKQLDRLFSNTVEESSFDQQMKQKYLKEKNTYDQDFQLTDTNKVKKQITEEYQDFAREFLNDKSRVEDFRNNIFGQTEEKAEQEEKNVEREVMNPLESYFSKGTNDQFMKRTQDLKTRFQYNQTPNIDKVGSIDDDYGNYSSFQSNFAHISKKSSKFDDTLNSSIYTIKNVQNFVDSLDGDVYEKQNQDSFFADYKQEYEEDRKLNPHLPKLNDKELKENYLRNEEQVLEDQKSFKPNYEIGEEEDNEELNEDDPELTAKSYRLSPWARNDIYFAYMDGWSVRDLSNRFGILPARVKAVIYMRAKFFNEILPNITQEEIKLGLQREMAFIEYDRGEWVDYGLDIEDMSAAQQGMLTTTFARHKVSDAGAYEELDSEEKREIQKKLNRKQDFVTIKFQGKGTGGYFIKDLIKHKGKGSDKVSQMFKKVLHNSHTPYRLPNKVRENLHKGPRAASAGFGFK